MNTKIELHSTSGMININGEQISYMLSPNNQTIDFVDTLSLGEETKQKLINTIFQFGNDVFYYNFRSDTKADDNNPGNIIQFLSKKSLFFATESLFTFLDIGQTEIQEFLELIKRLKAIDYDIKHFLKLEYVLQMLLFVHYFYYTSYSKEEKSTALASIGIVGKYFKETGELTDFNVLLHYAGRGNYTSIGNAILKDIKQIFINILDELR